MTQVAETAAPSFTVTIPKWVLLVSAGVVMASLAPFLLLVAGHAHPAPATREVALFAHLACLVLGFGAVMVVDWVALLWVVRRRLLLDVLATATNVQVPIWAGYAGLVVSGLCLEPEIDVLRTQVKLVVVLVVGLNGLCAQWLHLLLQASPRRRVVVASVVCAGASQAGWWTATVIGFINAR